MNLFDLHEQVKNGKVVTPLIFVGEEYKLIDLWSHKLFDIYNEEYFTLETVEDWVNKKALKNIFSSKTTLCCVKYDTSILTQPHLWEKLEGLILILQTAPKPKKKNTKKSTKKKNEETGDDTEQEVDETAVDEGKIVVEKKKVKKDFFEFFEDNIVNFTHSAERNPIFSEVDKLNALKAICLQKDVNISETYLQWLLENCSFDYGRCLTELDKVFVFGKQANENLFKDMARKEVFYADTQDVVLEFGSSFMERNKDKVLSLYQDLKLTEPVMVTIAVLYGQLRNMLVVQSCQNPTAESTGLTDKQVNFLKWKSGKFSSAHLSNMVIHLSELDRKIKTGQIDEVIGLEQFICRWL